MTRRTWAVEEKLSMVLEMLKGQESVTSLCHRHSVAMSQAYRWRDAFVDLIKGFSIPGHLIQMAKTFKISPPELVRDRAKLLDILLDPSWRGWPMQFDVPAPCQLFGQLVAKAGIEGIVYPSKFGGKDCLAIFPQNFEGADVFVQLDDPPPGVQVRKLDATTWRRAAQPSQSHESLLMRLMRFIQGGTS